MTMTIGVISDTHGLIRPEALAALADVALIIHAGDVGAPEVLDALAAVAPVHAIRGNIDRDQWALTLPENRTVEAAGARIFVLHHVADLDFDPEVQGYSAVISGHSHRPAAEFRGKLLYLNPGSAGPRRFRLPVTVARLIIDGESLRPEIIKLST